MLVLLHILFYNQEHQVLCCFHSVFWMLTNTKALFLPMAGFTNLKNNIHSFLLHIKQGCFGHRMCLVTLRTTTFPLIL